MTETSKPSKAKSTSQNSETKLIRELASILEDTNLTEIEMEKGTLRIRVARTAGPIMAAPQAYQTAPVSAPLATQASTPSEPAAPAQSDPANHPGVVKSPMVGTAYTRPSPDADAFFKIGDSVKEGDTVLLIEAMKTFNPIVAKKSGKIIDLLVEDAQPVEFGEPLFIIA